MLRQKQLKHFQFDTIAEKDAATMLDGELAFVSESNKWYKDSAKTLVTTEGLRGAPVADNAELTALAAKDYERRKVLSTGNEYVFELAGPNGQTGDLLDDAATGLWRLQSEGKYRITMTADNAQGQGGIDDDVNWDTVSVDADQGGIVTLNTANDTFNVTTGDKRVNFTVMLRALGTGAFNGVCYIKDVSDGAGVRFGNGSVPGISSDGTFGQGSSGQPIMGSIPPNTTVTLDVRTVAAGSNQRMRAGSFIEFKEV